MAIAVVVAVSQGLAHLRDVHRSGLRRAGAGCGSAHDQSVAEVFHVGHDLIKVPDMCLQVPFVRLIPNGCGPTDLGCGVLAIALLQD